MLHSFSFGELALVFGIILVLFGGSRLASVGKSLGEGIANFKKGLNASPEEKPSLVVQSHEMPQEHNEQNTKFRPTQHLTSTGHVVDVETKVMNKQV